MGSFVFNLHPCYIDVFKKLDFGVEGVSYDMDSTFSSLKVGVPYIDYDYIFSMLGLNVAKVYEDKEALDYFKSWLDIVILRMPFVFKIVQQSIPKGIVPQIGYKLDKDDTYVNYCMARNFYFISKGVRKIADIYDDVYNGEVFLSELEDICEQCCNDINEDNCLLFFENILTACRDRSEDDCYFSHFYQNSVKILTDEYDTLLEELNGRTLEQYMDDIINLWSEMDISRFSTEDTH